MQLACSASAHRVLLFQLQEEMEISKWEAAFLPSALTLPCREESYREQMKTLSWPSCTSQQERRECGWGLRLEANTAGITFSFLGEVGMKSVEGTYEEPSHQLADIYPVCAELRAYEEHPKVKGGMSLLHSP